MAGKGAKGDAVAPAARTPKIPIKKPDPPKKRKVAETTINPLGDDVQDDDPNPLAETNGNDSDSKEAVAEPRSGKKKGKSKSKDAVSESAEQNETHEDSIAKYSEEMAQIKRDLAAGVEDGSELTDDQASTMTKRVKIITSILEALVTDNPVLGKSKADKLEGKSKKSRKRNKTQIQSDSDETDVEREPDSRAKLQKLSQRIASRDIPKVDPKETEIIKVYRVLKHCYNICDAAYTEAPEIVPSEYLRAVKIAIAGHQSMSDHVRQLEFDFTDMPLKAVQTYVDEKVMSFYGQSFAIQLGREYRKLKQGKKESMREFLVNFRMYLKLLKKSEDDEEVIEKFLNSIFSRKVMWTQQNR